MKILPALAIGSLGFIFAIFGGASLGGAVLSGLVTGLIGGLLSEWPQVHNRYTVFQTRAQPYYTKLYNWGGSHFRRHHSSPVHVHPHQSSVHVHPAAKPSVIQTPTTHANGTTRVTHTTTPPHQAARPFIPSFGATGTSHTPGEKRVTHSNGTTRVTYKNSRSFP